MLGTTIHIKFGKIHEHFITKDYFQGKTARIMKILDHGNLKLMVGGPINEVSCVYII